MDNIIIIRQGAFGDLIQADGALRDIRLHHKKSSITLITSPSFSGFMKRSPHIDNIIKDARKPPWRIDYHRKLINTIKDLNPAIIYDLQNSSRTRYYRRYLLSSYKWCFAAVNNREYDRELQLTPLHSYQQQLRNFGIKTNYTLQPNTSWAADDVSDLLLKNNISNRYITLITGCSARNKHKRWPFYNQLALKLLSSGFCVVTVPGPDEIDTVNDFPGIVLKHSTRVYNWFELAGVIKNSSYIIGNDTGPTHLAACMNKRGLAIFGSHASVESTGIKYGLMEAVSATEISDVSVDFVISRIHAYT